MKSTKTTMIGAFSALVISLLLWQYHELKKFPPCSTDASCEAYEESVKLNYRGVVD
jgi:hypothetical protein